MSIKVTIQPSTKYANSYQVVKTITYEGAARPVSREVIECHNLATVKWEARNATRK